MKSKELEVLPCTRCNVVPTFFSWPNEEFPILHFPVCNCKYKPAAVSLDIALSDYKYRNRNKKSVSRKANKRAAIIRWNSKVNRHINSKSVNVYVTCKFCKRDDLVWGKRPYKSAWNGRKRDYVLYETVELAEVDEPGTIIKSITFGGCTIKKRVKHVIHNCRSRKNVVSITYT